MYMYMYIYIMYMYVSIYISKYSQEKTRFVTTNFVFLLFKSYVA